MEILIHGTKYKQTASGHRGEWKYWRCVEILEKLMDTERAKCTLSSEE